MAAPDPKSGLRATSNPVVNTDDASSQALGEALSSSFVIVRLLIIALLVALVFSCLFQVKQNEVAIILRFGKPVGDTPDERVKRPGLHWSLPYPIDEVVKIPLGESSVVRSTSSWYLQSPADEAAGLPPDELDRLTPGRDGHVITSDGNILHVRAILRYRISDPVAYTFTFRNPTNLLVNALNNSVHWAAVRTTADNALYKDVPGFRDSVRTRLSQLIEQSRLGVRIDQIEVQTLAPQFVKRAFDMVIEAEQDRSKRINEAQGEYEKVTREAVGEAARVIDTARANGNALVQSLAADARFFHDQLPEYRKAPELVKLRLQLATIGRVFTNSVDKWYLPAGATELRMNLSREPEENVVPAER